MSVAEHTSLNFYGLQGHKDRAWCTHEVARVCINIHTIVVCA